MEQQDFAAIGHTAHWTAAVRAYESARADRLFHDPLATQLAGTEGEVWWQGLSTQQREGAAMFQPIRTRFFDDLLQRATSQDRIRQVILLAAGLDTRAFRLVWPAGTRLFELDQPTVVAYKARRLDEAGCGQRASGSPLASISSRRHGQASSSRPDSPPTSARCGCWRASSST